MTDADHDRRTGLLLAVVVLALIVGVLLLVGVRADAGPDCVLEKHGKGAYTARCVDR